MTLRAATEGLGWPGEDTADNRPSPPWGRGRTAAGAFSSRGGPGEGVKAVSSHADLTQCIHVSAHCPRHSGFPLP